MTSDKIITFMRIADYNKEFLPSNKRDLTGTELEKAIIENIYKDLNSLPGKIKVEVVDGIIISEYDPNDFTEEDDRKFRNSINLLTEKSYKKGEELLEELIEDYPLNAMLLYNLGMCYSEQGEYEKSIKPLEKATELMPYYSEAFTALGFSYNGLGKIEKAIDLTKKAIELNENNFYALRNMGSLFGSINKYDEAEKYLDKAILIEPSDPSALYGRALIAKEIGDFTKAKELLDKIITNGFDDRFIQLAKSQLTKLTSEEFNENDIRMDAVMYLLSAIKVFDNMSPDEIKNTAFEIALKGQNGFKIGELNVTYKIDSLGKECTGLQMVCYMFAGFKIIDPTIDVGFDLEKEYKMALSMNKNGI